MDELEEQPNLMRAIRREQRRNAEAAAVLEHRGFIKQMRKFIKQKFAESYWDVILPGCDSEDAKDVAYQHAKALAVKLEDYLTKRDLEHRIGSKFNPKPLCTIAALKVITVSLAEEKKIRAIKRQNLEMKETIYFMEDWYFNALGREVNKYIGGESGDKRIPILTKYRQEIIEAGLEKYRQCIKLENCRPWSAACLPAPAGPNDGAPGTAGEADDGEPDNKISRMEM